MATEIDLLNEIRDEQKIARGERQVQSNMLTEIHTVLMGPDNQPAAGLMARVASNEGRLARIERRFMWLLGTGAITGGGAWNWESIKSLFIHG